jgi:hypothetical protein
MKLRGARGRAGFRQVRQSIAADTSIRNLFVGSGSVKPLTRSIPQTAAHERR